jgi:hypothetical protein
LDEIAWSVLASWVRGSLLNGLWLASDFLYRHLDHAGAFRDPDQAHRAAPVWRHNRKLGHCFSFTASALTKRLRAQSQRRRNFAHCNFGAGADYIDIHIAPRRIPLLDNNPDSVNPERRSDATFHFQV